MHEQDKQECTEKTATKQAIQVQGSFVWEAALSLQMDTLLHNVQTPFAFIKKKIQPATVWR